MPRRPDQRRDHEENRQRVGVGISGWFDLRVKGQMDDHSKFRLGVFGLVALTICTLIISVSTCVYKINKIAFENGYEAAQQQGSHQTYWKKCR
jgi:hypothetical protein